MIDFANENDIQRLKQIWKICFKDDDSYIDFYFEHIFLNKETLVFRRDGQAVAMLRTFDCFAKVERLYPIRYIYAVATLPDYQGMGIAKKMMEQAEQQAREDGCFACVLIPQSESLFDFYGRIGYETCFYKSKYVLTASDMGKGNHENLEMSVCSFEDFCKQRKEYIEKLDFAIVHGDLMSKYVYQESLYTGAKIINLKSRTLQGYMVCYKINNKLVVKETSLSKTLLLTLFTKMAQEFDINTLEVYGPEKEWSESSVKYGMCKRFFEIEHSEDLRNWPYMNLMLD